MLVSACVYRIKVLSSHTVTVSLCLIMAETMYSVSYTHLTLPTICSV